MFALAKLVNFQTFELRTNGNFNMNKKSDYVQEKVKFSILILRNIIKKARFITHFYSYVHLKYVQ